MKFWAWLFSEENTDENMQKFKEFIPQYHGIEERGGSQYIVLENLLDGYDHSNFMDVKLGKVTWAPYKEEAKVQSQIEKNKTTTTGILGLRVTGLVVKDGEGSVVEQSNKDYNSISADTVHETFAKIVTQDGTVQREVVE